MLHYFGERFCGGSKDDDPYWGISTCGQLPFLDCTCKWRICVEGKTSGWSIYFSVPHSVYGIEHTSGKFISAFRQKRYPMKSWEAEACHHSQA